VAGLAPSAAAAQVLADELGIDTDNTAKWLLEQEHRPDRTNRIAELTARLAGTRNPGSVWSRRIETERLRLEAELDRWTLRPGRLLIIDEATLAGTLTLDTIANSAREAGAKVVLVGDWAQLGAIEAGGAFHMLATDRADTPHLADVHRFTEPWEAAASLQLRTGDRTAVEDYLARGRVHCGDQADMIHALFDAWHADTQAGLDSIMIAPDENSVRDLNTLAQAQRRDSGQTGERAVQIADGQRASVGDRILTRRNDRRLRVDDRTRWVKNGDQWTVIAARADGSLVAVDDHSRAVVLPADYVETHVELGYATTVHRAQGRTFDTAHALVNELATRESLYVAMTRGRTANTVYIASREDVESDDVSPNGQQHASAELLTAVLERSAAEASAHAHARAAESERVERNGFVLRDYRLIGGARPVVVGHELNL
jgi:ATP-dependent exoDNAse (exonuclease V) alpha subunit